MSDLHPARDFPDGRLALGAAGNGRGAEEHSGFQGWDYSTRVFDSSPSISSMIYEQLLRSGTV